MYLVVISNEVFQGVEFLFQGLELQTSHVFLNDSLNEIV